MAGNYNYSNFLEWMYKKIDDKTRNFSEEFIAEVDQFMTFANSQPIMQRNGGKFLCPCSVCKNNKFIPGSKIWRHIYLCNIIWEVSFLRVALTLTLMMVDYTDTINKLIYI